MTLKRPLQAIFVVAVCGFVVRAYLASRIKDQHDEMRATQDARTRAALAGDIESAKRRDAAAARGDKRELRNRAVLQALRAQNAGLPTQ